MIETQDPKILFQQIWNDLETSMHAIDHGGKLDMLTLDNKVREFCYIVTSLPPEQAKLYSPKLRDITKHLEQIVNRLNDKKESVKEEINLLSQRQKAQAAYNMANLNNSKDE